MGSNAIAINNVLTSRIIFANGFASWYIRWFEGNGWSISWGWLASLMERRAFVLVCRLYYRDKITKESLTGVGVGFFDGGPIGLRYETLHEKVRTFKHYKRIQNENESAATNSTILLVTW